MEHKAQYDGLLNEIASYVHLLQPFTEEAYDTALACLMDSMGCAILALRFPECTKLLGPLIAGTVVPKGSRVPGTPYILDPIRAAFNIGTMIRWLDYNDTWLASEWGHPSDNLGGILALGDYLCRTKKPQLTVQDLLTAMIKAYEVQGGLAILNSFNRVGFDHVIFVKAATAAVATLMMDGTFEQIRDALSQVWADVGPLRAYRHKPNTGSRKSWAAGDATARGLQLAWMTMVGEKGYPKVLSASQWGLYDVLFKGEPFKLQRPLGSYVMENILFKISFPAEFHAQTAVEAAILLHPKVKNRWEQIETIEIETQESAMRIIDKTGPLKNPADRDHCLQYMVAVGLLFGKLTAEDYEEETAEERRIDLLREKMMLRENKRYTQDYLDPGKRSIANKISIKFKDGSSLEPVEVEYPVGHRKRRSEGLPLLYQKFEANLRTHYSENKCGKIIDVFKNKQQLKAMRISDFIDLLI